MELQSNPLKMINWPGLLHVVKALSRHFCIMGSTRLHFIFTTPGNVDRMSIIFSWQGQRVIYNLVRVENILKIVNDVSCDRTKIKRINALSFIAWNEIERRVCCLISRNNATLVNGLCLVLQHSPICLNGAEVRDSRWTSDSVFGKQIQAHFLIDGKVNYGYDSIHCIDVLST